MRLHVVFLLGAGCSSAPLNPTHAPAPTDVANLPSDSCGRFELTFDKGTPKERAAQNVRARCESSYICTPRVSSNRVEVAGVGPGSTKLHLEFEDPESGKTHSTDSVVTVTQAPVRKFKPPSDCQYVPLRSSR